VSLTPVTFEADYVEPRSRLTTFFRVILAIPHFIVMTVWGIAASVAVIVAWFALVFTGRWPRALYDFTAGFMRYSTAANGYLYLLTDDYPPFSGDVDRYPVRLGIGEPKPEYNRMKALFRIILAIPPYLIAYAMNIVAYVGAIISWLAIVILGKQPKGLQDMIELGLSYQQRAYAYMFLLIEDWPPFTSPQPMLSRGTGPGAGLPPAPPAPGMASEASSGTGSFAPPVPPQRRDEDERPPSSGGMTSGDPLA
jgi:hypothetical protein